MSLTMRLITSQTSIPLYLNSRLEILRKVSIELFSKADEDLIIEIWQNLKNLSLSNLSFHIEVH